MYTVTCFICGLLPVTHLIDETGFCDKCLKNNEMESKSESTENSRDLSKPSTSKASFRAFPEPTKSSSRVNIISSIVLIPSNRDNLNAYVSKMPVKSIINLCSQTPIALTVKDPSAGDIVLENPVQEVSKLPTVSQLLVTNNSEHSDITQWTEDQFEQYQQHDISEDVTPSVPEEFPTPELQGENFNTILHELVAQNTPTSEDMDNPQQLVNSDVQGQVAGHVALAESSLRRDLVRQTQHCRQRHPRSHNFELQEVECTLDRYSTRRESLQVSISRIELELQLKKRELALADFEICELLKKRRMLRKFMS